MKVCLIHPAHFFRDFVGVGYNQSLFYLYSYLRQRLPEAEIVPVDLTRELGRPRSAEEIAVFLAETETLLARVGFDFVGLSCWSTFDYPSCLEIARICKRLNPEAPLIVGGWHATFVPDDFRFPGSPFDFVVQGNGEQAMADILAGLVPAETSPVVVKGRPLPLEDYALRWGEYRYHRNQAIMPVFLSLGCPFACAFCGDRLSQYRFMAPQSALQLVREVLAALPETEVIGFGDPLFGIRKDWRREFLALLRQADLPVRYWAETRVDLLEKEDLDLIAALPFRMDFGLESVVPELLAIMKKTTDPQKYLARFHEIDDYMNRLKLPHTFNQIFNHPGETSRSLQQSLDFWRRYYVEARSPRYSYLSGNVFQLLPGGDTYNNWQDYAAKYGCTTPQREGWWKQGTYPCEVRSGDVVASRELAEAGATTMAWQVLEQVTQLAVSYAELEPFRQFKTPPPVDNLDILLPQGLGYLDDKPLRLSHRATLVPRLDGSAQLTNFATLSQLQLAHQNTEQLQAALGGELVGHLVRRLAEHHPDPAARMDELRRFFARLMYMGFLEFGLPEPVASGNGDGSHPLVRLRTSAGELAIRLFPAEAPRAVTSLLQLIERRVYEGLLFLTRRPSQYIDVGGLTTRRDGPGYWLEPEPGRAATRGSVALVRREALVHASLLRFYRAPPPPDDVGTVLGEVVEGLETLDQLLPGDLLLAATILDGATGVGQPVEQAAITTS